MLNQAALKLENQTKATSREEEIPMSPKGLVVRGVSKFFGSVGALHRVSLTWEPGKITSLLGPSGSGKTTLGEIIAGLVTPDEGEIIMDGQDITRMNPSRRKIPLMPQEWELFPHLTALENVSFGLWAAGVDRRVRSKRAMDLLRVCGLAGREYAFARELSGGQQQRVALARALATPSPFVILDEPFTSVDQDRRSGLRDLLAEEARRGRAILLITHDRTDALMLSQTIHCLLGGRLIMSGTPQETYEEPSSLQAALLTGEAFIVPMRPKPSEGDLELPSGLRRADLPLKKAAGDRIQLDATKSCALGRPEWLTVASDGIYHLAGHVVSMRYTGSHYLVNLQDVDGVCYQAYIDSPPPMGAVVPLCVKKGIELPVVPV